MHDKASDTMSMRRRKFRFNTLSPGWTFGGAEVFTGTKQFGRIEVLSTMVAYVGERERETETETETET